MRQVAIDRLVPGMVTARQVFSPGDSYGLPLIASKVMLTEAIIERLKTSGVIAVVIDDELSQGIESDPPISDSVRSAAVEAVKSTVTALNRPDTIITQRQVSEIAATIDSIVAEISARPNLLVCLSDLNSFGGPRFEHAVQVCVCGCAIAKCHYEKFGWLDFRGQVRFDQVFDRLQKLGIGLLLQDVGTLAIPDTIWHRRDTATGAERELIVQHPLTGIELLRTADLSPLSTVAISQHHERHDGSGYPKGLRGEEIHDHGRIAGIADTYVSLCEPPNVGGLGLAPAEAYRVVCGMSGGLFDTEVVESFAATVAPYGPGHTVQLVDGRYGIVVENTEDPLRPVIRITHDRDGMMFDPCFELNLNEDRDVAIASSSGGLPSDDFDL